MLKLQQFYILKLDSARLKESRYNIKSLTIQQARLNGELVQIANSQLVRTIRAVRRKIFSQYALEQIILEKEKLTRYKNNRDARERLQKINNELDDLLFVPEIISVDFSDRRHFTNILAKGYFSVNGLKYVPFMSSAGQIRRSSSLFIDSGIKDAVDEIFNNGRDLEMELVPAKFSAYYALYSSSSLPVSFPRLAVVSDLIIKTIRRVDFSTYIDRNNDPLISEREMEIEANAFDGAGLMSPEYAKKIGKDLDLDYLPASVLVRAPFLKGLLATFDFHAFADQIAKKKILIDVYGNEVNTDNIDCIVSQSMLKLWDSYASSDEYVAKCAGNSLDFGVAKVSPKFDKTYCRSSYQFLQVLNLSNDDIEELCRPTLDWLNQVSGGELETSLMFSLGDVKFEKGWFKRLEALTQALLLENSLIRDSYVISHLDKNIAKKKNDAKIGRLVFSGNYTGMIPDPYLYACHIFGIELRPLLNDSEHYSKYWNERGVTRVAAIRSPIVHSSEVNILNLKQNDELDKWFGFINSGVIFPAHGIGMDCAINGGSDFDGDLVATIDHPAFIKGRGHDLPIVYETKKADKSIIDKSTENVVIDSQVRQIRTNKIGFFTNISSTLYSLLANFVEGSPEHISILNRLKYGRVLQGLAIDSAKGILTDPFPEYWAKWHKPKDDLADEERRRIIFNNSIVAEKRPYFMRWLYSHYNNVYRRELLRYNNISKTKWRIKFEDLLILENPSKEQNELIAKYKRYSFFINNDSTMNRVTRHVERMIINIKFNRKNLQAAFDPAALLSASFKEPLKRDTDKMVLLYREYKSLKRNMRDSHRGYDGDSGEFFSIQQMLQYINHKAYATISSNTSDIADLAVYCVYNILGKNSKSFLWQVFGREVVENIKAGRTDKIVRVPMRNPKGSREYLWDRFGMYLLNFEDE